MSKIHLHEKRGITFQELGAFLGVRALLAGGLLEPAKERDENNIPKIIPDKHLFDMNVTCHTEDCGTVSCIGGTMELIAPNGIDWEKFDLLFYPSMSSLGDDWRWVTPAIAVQAMDNWLATGNPKWRKLRAAANKPRRAKKAKAKRGRR